MPLSLPKFNATYLAVITVTVLFLISLFLGLQKGVLVAKAKNVNVTVIELQKGLDIFFKDQDRFPYVEEFSDTNVLLTYFSKLPDNVSKNSNCLTNFDYKWVSAKNYELDFCLAANLGNFKKGWNKISEQK